MHTAKTPTGSPPKPRTLLIGAAFLATACAAAIALTAAKPHSDQAPHSGTAAPVAQSHSARSELPSSDPNAAADWPSDSTAAGDMPGVDGPPGLEDGIVPRGATVLDTQYPGVANLDPELLEALQQAADAARLPFYVNSGWRTPKYQEALFWEAVGTYGSEAEAARWVAAPDKSLHVSGAAVDLGADAAEWLARHGAAFGLCLVYRNEPWHFELRPEAPTRGCPLLYTDPTEDPRLW
jgi:LAS superfamily LD-carboxypeptidase LdcB